MSAQVQVQASATLTQHLPTRRRSIAGLMATAGTLLAGCSGQFAVSFVDPAAGARAQPPLGATIGAGEVKAALILPLSAPGNAGVAGQAMRNAAEMALAEFNAPNIQLLVKDDAGTAEAARLGAQQALDEGAEIIFGPLFAQSVSFVGQVARSAQCAGDRLLDRHQCRLERRLSAELPAGIRRRAHRAICQSRPGSTPSRL